MRPKLEYNTSVWSPYLLKDINAIEKVQQRYTKIVCRRCNIPYASYADRLVKLDMLSLQHRRVRFDLIKMFQIVNNMSDLRFDAFFAFQNSPYSLRHNSHKIIPKQRFNSSAWNGSFFERAPRYWNKLSDDIASVSSLNTFKIKLISVSYDSLLQHY